MKLDRRLITGLFLVSTLALTPVSLLGQSSDPNWFEIADSDGHLYFFDLNSRRIREGQQSGWILTHDANGSLYGGKKVAYDLTLYAAECDNETLKINSLKSYTRNGSVALASSNLYEEFASVAPGTIAASILQAICGNHRSLVGPSKALTDERLYSLRLQRQDGTATLREGSWSFESGSGFHQVKSGVWVKTKPTELQEAAVVPPNGTFRKIGSDQIATKNSNGVWTYDAHSVRVSETDLAQPGIAIHVDTNGVESIFLARNGLFFRKKYSVDFTFEQGQVETFGEFRGVFDGEKFVPTPTYIGTEIAIEYARSIMPYVTSPTPRRAPPRPKRKR